MYFFFSGGSVVWVFIAGVLFFVVSQRLELTAPRGALAVKLAAGAALLDVALPFIMNFAGSLLYSLPFNPFQLLPVLLGAGFWGCLAWAVVEVARSAPAPSGPGGHLR